MKALVVYDTVYGNTEKIAEAIGTGLEDCAEVKVYKVNEVDPKYLDEYNLVIAGSPTQGGRPLPSITKFLASIPDQGLKGVDVTAFDTSIPYQGKGFFYRTFIKMLGYAAPRIGNSLKNKGANIILAPESFFVEDKDGPLSTGEEQRASIWAASIATPK